MVSAPEKRGCREIDGTKIEANANRYTFVWRGSINYHLAGLLYTIDSLYSFGRNLNKYYRFLRGKIKKFEGKEEQIAA